MAVDTSAEFQIAAGRSTRVKTGDCPAVGAATITVVNQPTNIIALDQEEGGLVAVVNGVRYPDLFHPASDAGTTLLAVLPAGGGLIVADTNAWQVRNELSVAQFAWSDYEDLTRFLAGAGERGYACRSIPNRLARTLYLRAQLPTTHAAEALYRYGVTQVQCSPGATFDAGQPVRITSTGSDNSFGHRAGVVRDFLRQQNLYAYDTPFGDDVVTIARASLSRRELALLNVSISKDGSASCTGSKRNRLIAVAVCTHDPETGMRRGYEGRPWSGNFIVRRLLGLNGTTSGVGTRTAGNPMRATLRMRSQRAISLHDVKDPVTKKATGATELRNKINAAERRESDAAVRALIRALQAHPRVSSVYGATALGHDTTTV